MRRALHLHFETLESREVPAAMVAPLPFDPAHILVKWTDGIAHATRFTRAAENLGGGLFRLTLKDQVTAPQAIAGISRNANVAIAQPDYQISIARVPSDPSAASQWSLHNTGQNGGTADADIDAPEAWNTATGTRRTIVAVIDSGIDYNHPDLAANMWRNVDEIPGNGIDDDRNGFKDDYYGYDFANNDASPLDRNGHGTHVAGIIGAVGNNGIGVSGVNWNTQIMALQFLDAGGRGYMSNAARAINYAVKNGAKIINASFGSSGNDAALAAAIANARAKGVIVVAAAGNSAYSNDTSAVYPASYGGDNVVAVAATDRNDKLAAFSNYGRTAVDIAAPGASIQSTLPNGKYGGYSGTSMAAPHVAGALALVWDAHPTWTYRQVIDAVLKTADALPGLAGKVATGRLNLAKALSFVPAAIPAWDTAGAQVTAVEFNGSGSIIDRARVTFSEPMKPITFSAIDLRLTAPNGKRIAIAGVAPVAGTNNTRFDITFKAPAATGDYRLVIGPYVRDLAGNPMDQNRNGVNADAGDKYAESGTVSSPGTAPNESRKVIPDRGMAISTRVVTRDITVADLNVHVNLAHPNMSDVRLTLVAPDGTRVVLFNRRGGDGDNLSNTVFDDEGTNSIYRGAAPFAGSYKPEYVLKAFDGKNAKGTWQLLAEDTAVSHTGMINGWSMEIAEAHNGATTPANSFVAAWGLPSAPANSTGRNDAALASMFVRV